MRKIIGAFGVALALVAALFIGGGAVTNADSGINVPTTEAGGVVTNGTYKPALVNIDGTISRVASGTTTKTLIYTPASPDCSAANLKTWWGDYNGPGNYTETQNTAWNVPGYCGDGELRFFLIFFNNDGTHSGSFDLDDGETIPNDIDTVGSGTSKVKLSRWCGGDYLSHWIVTAPWGTDQVVAPC